MIQGKKLEPEAYEAEHIQAVLSAIEGNFRSYFDSFVAQPLEPLFGKRIQDHRKEQEVYKDYLDPEVLEEYESDASAFKADTRKVCPIIRKCLMSQDEAMKVYKRSYNDVSGRQLLDTVRNISEFGRDFMAGFDDETHLRATTFSDLGLEPLNEDKYYCPGVIGYGIQSGLLHGLYPRHFAHRSQDAVWSLHFLSGRQRFGLDDGSEFLIARPESGTCEQNYFYPAELFGFYALKLFLMLGSACANQGIRLHDHCRYIYLSAFCDHVAALHRDDINTYKRSSKDVESQPWF